MPKVITQLAKTRLVLYREVTTLGTLILGSLDMSSLDL